MYSKLLVATALAVSVGSAFAAADAPSGYTKCAQPGGTCTMSGTHLAAMGKAGVFGYATFTGNFACSLSNFPGAPSNSTWCSYDPATASSSSSSVASSSSSSVKSSSSSSVASSSSSSSVASSSSSSKASSSSSSSVASSSSSSTTGAPAIYNLNAPSMPSTVCASLNANLAKNSKGLLNDSVDAPPAATQPDTSRIQSAIDNCAAGAAVKLVTSGGSNAFLTGPLQLKSGVTLWIDSGVTLFASRNPDDYATTSGSCGIEGSGNSGCKPLIYALNTDGSGIVGAGAIDGRGGAVMTGGANSGKWTWWDLSMASTIDGKNQQSPRILQVTSSKNFTMYNITLLNGPHFHVATSEVVGFKVYGIKLLTPSLAYSVAGYACSSSTMPSKSTVATKPSTCFTPGTVKNTDGFDPANSQYVVITQSYISTGDDHIAVKAGAVTSTSSVSTNHMYANNHFYYGHGMSIGSETDAGAHDISVTNLTIDGMGDTLSGLRIKSDNSRGGEVYNVTYDTVCMKNIKNPLFFTTQYTTASGSKLPDFHDITMRNVHYTSSTGTLQYVGSSTYPLNRFTFDNVVLDTALSTTQSNVTNTIYGPGAVVNVGLSGAPTIAGSGIDCSGKWIAMATAFPGLYQ